MKATKQATPGTFSRSAPARGKFWKICLVLLLLVTAVFCGFAPRAWADPAGCWTDVGEDGKPLYADTSWYYDNPNADESPEEYDLWDEADLAGLAYLVNNDIDYFYSSRSTNGKIVRLRAPVDMSAHYWEPIGTFRTTADGNNFSTTTPGFVGTFDGGNHEISGIVVKRDETNLAKSVYAGFFGSTSLNTNHPDFTTSSNAYPLLTSINIVNAYIEGWLEPHTFTNKTSSGTIQEIKVYPMAAGIVADAGGTSGTTIRDCTFSGFVEGYDAAGIVGQNNSGSTTSCVNKGGVSAVRYAGGITARMVYQGAVVQSTNEGPVASKFAAGGIAGAHGTVNGRRPNDISYCSSTGPVYGETYSGAIAGYMGGSTVGREYDTNYYWLNGTGADVFPEGQDGNAKRSLGGSEEELTTAPKEANKVDTLAEMPPTTVIFSYADTPWGRKKEDKTVYTSPPGRFFYPDDEGVYMLGPVAVYPTGSAAAENMIIESLNQTTLSRTKLTKEEYSKAYAVCMTQGYTGYAGMGVHAENDDRMEYTTALGLLRVNPMMYREKSIDVPSITLSGATLKAGETAVLTASFDPDTTPQSVRGLKWSSDNESVATVDASGKVTAVGVGQARITATSEVFEEASPAECVVTVNKNDTPPEPAKDPVVNVDGAKEQSAAPTVPADTELPEGVTVTPSLSPSDESAALNALKSGGETGTPYIDGIDQTEPGAVNALTMFSLDVEHDAADGDLTITLTLADALNVAEGSSLYAFIPYRDDQQKFGSFACTPANGAEITSVTFTVTGYARFFSEAPVILAAVKGSAPQPAPSGGGGGGGCSAGLGALALLAIVPLFARRKK